MFFRLLSCVFAFSIVDAAKPTKKDPKKESISTIFPKTHAGVTAPPVFWDGKQALVVDGKSGTTLLDLDADKKMTPSSMTKILTAYLLFEKIKEGKYTLDSQFPISRKAKRVIGTKMYLDEGKTVSVRDLIQGMFVASGNDACICVAETIAGSEESFAVLMNEKAKAFGCQNSHFTNASGLPDENHYSSCRDLYLIAKHMYDDFPEYLEYYKQQTFEYEEKLFKNLNRILKTFSGADGLKTGHTEDGGYGVIVSAIVNNQRIFSIFNGCRTMVERNKVSDTLMSWAYGSFDNLEIVKKETAMGSISTWMAKKETLLVGADSDLFVIIPKGRKATTDLVVSAPIEAPVKKGDVVGSIETKLDGVVISKVPAVALEDLQKANIFVRFFKGIYHGIFGK